MSDTTDKEDEPAKDEPAKDEPAKDEPAKDETSATGIGGTERPAFLEGFPADPELDRLVRAFEVGNYAFVREHGPKLVDATSSEKVRAAARELLARIEPDPLMKHLLLGAILLFCVLTFYAYHSHGP